MLPESPRPDEEGIQIDRVRAERVPLASAEADAAARRHWEAEADAYQAEHAAFLGGNRVWVVDSAHPTGRIDYPDGGGEFVWGPEGWTEHELGVLGSSAELVGQRVLEVGCGAAQCSTWLAARGVRAVGIDISVNQMRHAPEVAAGGHAAGPAAGSALSSRKEQGSRGLVAATATALPFPDAAFDAAFSAYGAVQFVADLDELLAEVARVLRPGGRWCFSVTHPLRWAFPDDPGQIGLGVSGSYFDRTPYIERDEHGVATYAEFHRTTADYVLALTRAGFVLDALLEPEWPDWNDQTWGGWSPSRGSYLPGTLILGTQLRH